MLRAGFFCRGLATMMVGGGIGNIKPLDLSKCKIVDGWQLAQDVEQLIHRLYAYAAVGGQVEAIFKAGAMGSITLA
jgi:hypothetical protein